MTSMRALMRRCMPPKVSSSCPKSSRLVPASRIARIAASRAKPSSTRAGVRVESASSESACASSCFSASIRSACKLQSSLRSNSSSMARRSEIQRSRRLRAGGSMRSPIAATTAVGGARRPRYAACSMRSRADSTHMTRPSPVSRAPRSSRAFRRRSTSLLMDSAVAWFSSPSASEDSAMRCNSRSESRSRRAARSRNASATEGSRSFGAAGRRDSSRPEASELVERIMAAASRCARSCVSASITCVCCSDRGPARSAATIRASS